MERQPENGILEEFRIEFWDCWQRLPNKTFFFILLIAWLALFQFLGNATVGYVPSRSLMYWMFRAYNGKAPEVQDENHQAVESPDGHGNLVPFVVLGLFWWKRRELLAADIRSWWPGLALVGAGLCFHLLGFAVQQPRISIIGLFTGIYGLTGLAWGPAWLARSFFPFCLFAFAMPLGSMAEPITFRLRLIVSQLVELVSHFILQIDIVRIGTKLVEPNGRYEYEIAAACSGIRSLVATVGLALILGVVSFRVWWKRALMIASALPLAIAGNLLRMLTIVIAAELGGQELGKKVHDGGPGGIFSLLPYVPAFFGLLALEHYLRKVGPVESARPVSAEARHGAVTGSASAATPVPATEVKTP